MTYNSEQRESSFHGEIKSSNFYKNDISSKVGMFINLEVNIINAWQLNYAHKTC